MIFRLFGVIFTVILISSFSDKVIVPDKPDGVSVNQDSLNITVESKLNQGAFLIISITNNKQNSVYLDTTTFQKSSVRDIRSGNTYFYATQQPMEMSDDDFKFKLCPLKSNEVIQLKIHFTGLEQYVSSHFCITICYLEEEIKEQYESDQDCLTISNFGLSQVKLQTLKICNFIE